MLFMILILIFLGAIVFFHYIQGFFSSVISAILAVFSAVIAFSYHESVVPLLGGKMADFAAPIALLAMFGLTYTIMRVAFDKAIPGNIRLPLAVDKGGAVVMGLIAGIFATGIMAIAAAEMPFGPDLAGFTRFDSEAKRQQKVDIKGKAFYSETWYELTSDIPGQFGDSPRGVPIVQSDNALIGLITKLSSETGSLQNGKPLETVHPDFLTEAFGHRLGIEPSSSHNAVNIPSAHIEQVKVLGLFNVDPKIVQSDGDNMRKPIKPVAVKGTELLMAVRVMFTAAAADADTYVRFSPGSIRLMLHDNTSSAEDPFKDYYPIGTMEGTGRIFINKLDDFLYCKGGNGADIVFVVPKKLVEKGVTDGSFVQVKANAIIDLSGMKLEPQLTPNADVLVMRKDGVLHPEAYGGTPLAPPTPSSASAAPAPSSPQQAQTPSATPPKSTPGSNANLSASSEVPVKMSLPPGADANALLSVPGGGTAKLENGKLKNINMDASSLELKAGNAINAFAVPQGQAMIQVKISPSGAPAVAWAFASEPEQYEIVDSAGKHYQPNGIVALYRGTTGERVKVRYIDSQTISGAAAPDGAEAPAEAYLLFNVPANTTIVEFDEHGQKAKAGNVVAK